uniref:Uncharacterized protein n=1 Tax=Arundo donax TaxID=35708 RepID=A0A0A9B3S3_ARUDO
MSKEAERCITTGRHEKEISEKMIDLRSVAISLKSRTHEF